MLISLVWFGLVKEPHLKMKNILWWDCDYPSPAELKLATLEAWWAWEGLEA